MVTSSNKGLVVNTLPFYKTIRFKLTLLYSSILFLFSATLVFIFNVYLNQYFNKEPTEKIRNEFIFLLPPQPFIENFQSLRIEERKRIIDLRRQDLARIQLISIYSLIPLAVGSFALGYYVSGSFLSPLGKLRNEIEALEQKDLGKTLSTGSDDEIGALVNSFNNLSSRLETAFKSQEQFVQDASHELRTPMTIIQTNLDTILDDKNATKEEIQDGIRDALVGVKQLNKLISYLLDLTNTSATNFTEINLQTIVNQQITTLKELALHNKIIFEQEKLPESLTTIKGDEVMIGRVIFNLLENACKYSSGDTEKTVKISYQKDDSMLQVKISNPGIELSKEQCIKIFERFYQIEQSRNKKVGGYGLGLAIAKKIMQEHNGDIFASSEKGINTFTLIFPFSD